MKLKHLFVLTAVSLSFANPTLADNKYPAFVKDKELYAKNDLRGQQAPKLEVQKWLNGEAPNTAGKVVLIDFWATWCGPCRQLIPELNEIKKKYGDDIVILGISDESEEVLKTFMKSHKFDYLVGIDSTKAMKTKVGVSGIPHVIITSPDNIVRWQGYPQSPEDPLTIDKVGKIIAASKGK